MILCQEGYRPGTKITSALSLGLIDGAILTPRYHNPAELGATIESLLSARQDAYVLVDPEFHLGAVDGDKVGKLTEYAHYHDELDWRSFSASRVARYVEEVFAFQSELPLTRLISPGVPIRALRDWNGSAALSLYDESIKQLGQPEARDRLLLALVLGDELFQNKDDVDDLLNALTVLDCRGFYITVDRQNNSDTLWCGSGQDTALGNYLYLIHALSINGFEVICGYTDFNGVLMLGAGASAVASGWFKKQRLFDSGRYVPVPPGGRAPKDYYASLPIMNWIALSPDIDILEHAGLVPVLKSDTSFDAILEDSRRNENWTLQTSIHTFWEAMKHVDAEMTGAPDAARFDAVNQRLALAESRWGEIRAATRTAPALTTTSTNIPCWKQAQRHFLERLSR